MKKKAATNPQFERSFSDLAFAYVRDRAPKLLEHMVGFQVIDKSEDETHAVGAFGFKVGKQWLYAPMFFLNGEVRGYDLLYVAERDIFIPLQENWVNYLLNRRPPVLGEGSDLKPSDFAASTPDFSVYSDSPLGQSFSKFSFANYDASRRSEVHGYWYSGQDFDLTPVLPAFQVSPNGDTFKKAAARLDLREVVKNSGLKAALYKSCKLRPGLSAAIARFYDINDIFPEAVKAAQHRRDCYKAALRSLIAAEPVVSKAAETIEITKVRTIRRGDSSADLSDDSRKELVCDGIAVLDSRDKAETSQVYSADAVDCLTNPDGSGSYDVLVKPDSFVPATVFCGPKTIGSGSAAGVAVVIRNDTKQHICVDQKAVICKPVTDHEIETQAGVADLERGDTAVVVAADNTATLPFVVIKRCDDVLYVHSRDYLDGSEGFSEAAAPQICYDSSTVSIAESDDGCAVPQRSDDLAWYENSVRLIILSDKVTHLQPVGNTLYVPRDSRVIKLKSFKSGLQLALGTIADAEAAVVKTAGVVPLQIATDGYNYDVVTPCGREHYSSKADVLAALCLTHGMHKDSAYKAAAAPQRYFIKYAQPYGPAAPSPAMLDNSYGYDPDLGVRVDQAEPTTAAVQGMATADPSDYADTPGWAGYGSSDPVAIAQRAAATGQKEVFDVATLAGLSNTTNVMDLVDSYLSDLTLSMDRIGRILFMYYWHNERFTDRYGDDDMQELEDALKSTFKSVGDLVLFLRRRAVEPDIASVGTAVDLADIA